MQVQVLAVEVLAQVPEARTRAWAWVAAVVVFPQGVLQSKFRLVDKNTGNEIVKH